MLHQSRALRRVLLNSVIGKYAVKAGNKPLDNIGEVSITLLSIRRQPETNKA